MSLRELATTDDVVWPVPKAGAVLGKGRTASYAAAARGEIPTITLNSRMVVPVPLLRRLIGLEPPHTTGHSPPGERTAPTVTAAGADENSRWGAEASHGSS